MRPYFHSDAVIRWHCTNEQFSLEDYIQANCLYPGAWQGEVERIEQNGEQIITVTHVWDAAGSMSCHAVSFMRMKAGRIAALDEFWSADGPAPAWRQAMGVSRPICREHPAEEDKNESL